MFPKLRFKEFDGDLTESKLVELTSWASGGTPAKDVPEYWGDGIPLISGASMHTNQLYESDVKITKLGLQKGSKLALKDSILILVRGSMLFNKIPMGITLGDVAFNQDVKCIRPKQQLAPLFLFQWLHAKENTIQNKVTATGIGAGKLDTADLQNLKLYKPSLEEQTKIATFLSAVDEKISQLTQKHQLLREYKQGMMQKLFSQQIRFKADDGSEFGEWEETTLEKIGTFLKGKGISKADIVCDGQIPCVRYGELYTHYGEVISKVISATNIDVNNLVLSKANDILIPASGETQIDIATASCILDDGIALSGDLNIFRTKENGIFLSYLIRSKLKMKIAQLAQGNSVVHLYATQLKGVELNLPCLEEQTKIANFLSAIDQKMDVVSKQLKQAKTWKKGLLQQMFV